MNKKVVGIYSVIHFIVDLSCAILVTNLVTQRMGQNSNLFIAILIYNFFAFAMQFPIGIIADKVNKNAICAAIGCFLVAIAFGFANYGIISCTIAGIGNAMFHIGGGIDVLNISDKKATPSGIFVSTGAIGIFLGSKSATIGFNKFYIVIFILLFSAVLLLGLYNEIKNKIKNQEIIIPKLTSNAKVSIICLILTVCIRSYVGLILAFEWKGNFTLALLSIFAVVFGKMLGGIIGDKIGFNKISIVSLAGSAICFVFAFNNPFLGILAMLFFNMTMPITLTALSNILDNNKGMAFGLLTLALFIGSIPKFFGIGISTIFTPLGLCFITIISLIILIIGIRKYDIFMEKKI